MTAQRILVALDASETADHVLDHAIELARSTGAKLRLLRVVLEMPPHMAPPVANIFEPAGDTNAMLAAAEADLLRREGYVPDQLRDGVAVVVGQPAEAICKNAITYNADLVVMGAHSYGVLERTLGTTAAKVVNHLDRPVIIVRPKKTVSAHPEKERAGGALNLGRHEHKTLGAATLAGAAAGAAVGALAGPPGAIAGGIIGTAIGIMAGATLEREDSKHEKHDHELDDEIGVTSGDLGARDAASSGLTKMQHDERGGGLKQNAKLTSLAKMLRAEHQRLERVYDNLLTAYRGGSWEDVRKQWADFEPALRRHMEAEEHQVFEAFRAAAPSEADVLSEEHAELRGLLETIAMSIELHAVPERDAEELVRRLREHGIREERILYPWLEREQPEADVARDLVSKTAHHAASAH